MTQQITLEFRDGTTLHFTDALPGSEFSDNPLIPTPPAQKTRVWDQLVDLMESWAAIPSSVLQDIFAEHGGNPIKATIGEVKPENVTLPEEAVYRFHWDCGRMGDVEGIFVASKEEVAAALGQHVFLGEVLGKHSEIHGVLDSQALTLLSDDPHFITVFKERKMETGYNPLDYIGTEED